MRALTAAKAFSKAYSVAHGVSLTASDTYHLLTCCRHQAVVALNTRHLHEPGKCHRAVQQEQLGGIHK